MQNTLIKNPTLDQDLKQVNGVIRKTAQETPAAIREEIERILASNGKMLRPMFLILSARTGNFKKETIYPLAAAVEMLHIATLVHDDILDNSGTRRGKEATHQKIGKKKAVLVGDYLFTRSFLLATEHGSTENSKKISRAVARICESELQQAESQFDADIDFANYHRRIFGKTAVLFSISCYIGAYEAGHQKPMVKLLERIGYYIGMAFQIIDDILDFTSKENSIGKPVTQDISQGIYTLPLIYALSDDDGTLKKLLKQKPYTEKTLEEIVQKTVELGGIKRARELAARYTEKAEKALNKIPECKAKENIKQLAHVMLKRNY